MDREVYRLIGMLSSPYSIKMRALFRYRRIPHLWIQHNERTRAEIQHLRPPLVPVVQYPDGSYHNDSTPVIYDMERRHPGRSVVPDDEGAAFLAHLLEDMADEWGTKMMFHHRWSHSADRHQVSEWQGLDELGSGAESISRFAHAFCERQVGRLPLVGCTEHNRPLLEATCDEVFALFNQNVLSQGFLFGSRPSLADFGWMGQLSQLAVDPTPSVRMRQQASFLFRWLMQMDDLSGLEEGHWKQATAPLASAVMGLLRMAGEVYLPFLEANEKAIEAGDTEFEFEARGMPYRQGTFRYQLKCLCDLRQRFEALAGPTRKRLAPALMASGCYEPLMRRKG